MNLLLNRRLLKTITGKFGTNKKALTFATLVSITFFAINAPNTCYAQTKTDYMSEDDDWNDDDFSDLEEEYLQAPVVKDPLEKLNRFSFKIFTTADKYLIKPVSKVYEKVSEDLRIALKDFSANTNTVFAIPLTTISLEPEKTSRGISRFVTNVFLGFGGFFDVASEFEIEEVKYSLSDVLHKYGVPQGPYFFNPFGGPSRLLSLVNYADSTMWDQYKDLEEFDAYDYINYGLLLPNILQIRIDQGERIDMAYKQADPYVMIRDFYMKMADKDKSKENLKPNRVIKVLEKN